MNEQDFATRRLVARRKVLKNLGGLGLLSVGSTFLGACGSGISTTPPAAIPGYRSVSVNAAASSGTIRSLQGVNGPPVPAFPGVENVPSNASSPTFGFNPVFNPSGVNLTAVYGQMRVDFVRTHDLDADGSGDVDGTGINCIFPDWNADPLNPSSYNFAATDTVIAGIVASGSQVLFNLGRSDLSMVGLANDATPPADFDKYAAIAKQIVLHYNEGWANGFTYGIRYWEIWNEPELLNFWTGTVPQYYSLYQKVATAIKSVDPTLKVGGPTLATNTPSFGMMGSFLQFLSSNSLPLDFYSFHWYANYLDPMDFSRLASSYRALLDQYGFTSTELQLTEWGYALFIPSQPAPETEAAFLVNSMTYMQDAPLDRAFLYQRSGLPLLQADGSLLKAGAAFQAVGSLTGMSRLSTSGQDTDGFSVLAGCSADKKQIRVLIGNYEIPAADMGPIPGGNAVVFPGITTITYLDRRTISYANNAGYQVTVNDLPWGAESFTVTRFRVDASHQLTLIDTQSGNGPQFTLSASLPPPSVELIVMTAA
jgi:xylan 1,4-beta-xylosidase